MSQCFSHSPIVTGDGEQGAVQGRAGTMHSGHPWPAVGAGGRLHAANTGELPDSCPLWWGGAGGRELCIYNTISCQDSLLVIC